MNYNFHIIDCLPRIVQLMLLTRPEEPHHFIEDGVGTGTVKLCGSGSDRSGSNLIFNIGNFFNLQCNATNCGSFFFAYLKYINNYFNHEKSDETNSTNSYVNPCSLKT
jgi:hypothetical protein